MSTVTLQDEIDALERLLSRARGTVPISTSTHPGVSLAIADDDEDDDLYGEDDLGFDDIDEDDADDDDADDLDDDDFEDE